MVFLNKVVVYLPPDHYALESSVLNLVEGYENKQNEIKQANEALEEAKKANEIALKAMKGEKIAWTIAIISAIAAIVSAVFAGISAF